MRTIGVGLLGLGTVGAEVYRLLQDRETVAAAAGCPVEVRRVAVARPERSRAVSLPPGILAPAEAVATAPDVDVVVELIGGLEPARHYLMQALARGASVVTANKALLAACGAELSAAAARSGAHLYFEGSVGGGIPLIRPISESLAGARLQALTGILNGTTNFILTRMAHQGWTLEQALAEARRRGFAEADPTEDLEGHDAASKLAILASVAFRCQVTGADVYREGITRITPRDFAYARDLGFTIKLLAVARNRDGEVEARVHPALIPLDHPLALVPDEFNAVLVEGPDLGRVVFSGRGAGGAPTATAVVGDIVAVARQLLAGVRGRPLLAGARRPIRPLDDLVVPYYLSLQVVDRPGVFARVAAVFGEEQVSIASIVQKSRGEVADVILVTHDAAERAVRRVLARLTGLDVVRVVLNVIRVDNGV
ncbi:MAG: homoserine dehydrogenase [Armatimonadota bacterium]|nr:homoserine dehydrogenase [Armatimonadota bacterium]MDR7612414.1 homoserine dehydrogenase [Armatimonadota bacterium]